MKKVNLIKERRKSGAVCSKCQSPDYKYLGRVDLGEDVIGKHQFECKSCGDYWQYGKTGSIFTELMNEEDKIIKMISDSMSGVYFIQKGNINTDYLSKNIIIFDDFHKNSFENQRKIFETILNSEKKKFVIIGDVNEMNFTELYQAILNKITYYPIL